MRTPPPVARGGLVFRRRPPEPGRKIGYLAGAPARPAE